MEILTKDQNITYERIRDLGKIYSLDNVKKIKFVRNPYDRSRKGIKNGIRKLPKSDESPPKGI
jgi:hypothetical protein